MANTFTALYYHFVWGTKLREPFINAELEPHLYRYLRSRCEELGAFVYALGGVEDHVHLACTLPVTLSIAEFLHRVKGGSAHFANHLPDLQASLYWQPGYGALTFARRDLTRVVAYIQNQKQHHQAGTLWAPLERFEDTPG